MGLTLRPRNPFAGTQEGLTGPSGLQGAGELFARRPEDSEKLLILRASLDGKTDKTIAAHAKATIFTRKQQIV